MAGTSRAWESGCADVQITLANFEIPQSIMEEQEGTRKRVK